MHLMYRARPLRPGDVGEEDVSRDLADAGQAPRVKLN